MQNVTKGDNLYVKGKHGTLYNVIVQSVVDNYACVRGNDSTFGTQTVRLGKLTSQPSKSLVKEQFE